MNKWEHKRAVFEQWYVENCFDLENNPVGSRQCGLQWASFCAALDHIEAENERLHRQLTNYRRVVVQLCGTDPVLNMDDHKPWTAEDIAAMNAVIAQLMANKKQQSPSSAPAEPLKIGDRVRLGEPFDEMGMGNGWTVMKIYNHDGLITVEHPSIGPAMVSAKTVTKIT